MWKKIFCCLCCDTEEAKVNEKNRLLPEGVAEAYPMQESGLQILSYGDLPKDLHMKLIPRSLFSIKVLKLACGFEHFLILTDRNLVLAGGSNQFGQCGAPPTGEEISEEAPLELFQIEIANTQILDIAAGDHHTMILGFSQNRSRLIGLGHETGCGFFDKQHKSEPTSIPLPSEDLKLIRIFAGHMRSAVLSESGDVFICGIWNSAVKYRALHHLKMPFEGTDIVKKIAIGKDHCLILTRKAALLGYGDNTYGELGCPPTTKQLRTPTLIPHFINQTVLDVAAGARHSLILEEGFKLYTCGDNSEGQCGFEAKRSYVPKLVSENHVFVDLSIRRIWTGDSHSAVLTDKGDLYVWGDNTANRLGVESNMSVYSPRPMDELFGKTAAHIGLGGGFTMVITGPKAHGIIT